MLPYPGAIPPPTGATATLITSPSPLTSTWLAAQLVELVVPTILLSLRVYTRKVIAKQWNTADVTCIIAWAFFVCASGTGIAVVAHGVGIDAWDITSQAFSDFLRIINYQQIVYMPAICLTKITILLQFINMFSTRTRSGRWWALLSLVCFNAIFFTILMFIEIFECIPRRKIWESAVPGHCLDIQQTFIATAVINVVDDLCIITLPIMWVLKLKVNRSKKLSMVGIFAVGVFACCCSIMRLAESILTVSNPNITVAIVPVSLWATAEISSGLVVACLPFLPLLLRRAMHRPSIVAASHESSDYRKRRSRRHWFSTIGTATAVGDHRAGTYITMNDISDRSESTKALAQENQSLDTVPTRPFAVHQGAINKTVQIEQSSQHDPERYESTG